MVYVIFNIDKFANQNKIWLGICCHFSFWKYKIYSINLSRSLPRYTTSSVIPFISDMQPLFPHQHLDLLAYLSFFIIKKITFHDLALLVGCNLLFPYAIRLHNSGEKAKLLCLFTHCDLESSTATPANHRRLSAVALSQSKLPPHPGSPPPSLSFPRVSFFSVPPSAP